MPDDTPTLAELRAAVDEAVEVYADHSVLVRTGKEVCLHGTICQPKAAYQAALTALMDGELSATRSRGDGDR